MESKYTINNTFLKDIGSKLFYLGIFLLPSAFTFSAVCLLIAAIIGFLNSNEKIFEDKINNIFLVGSIFILISGLINAKDFFEINSQFNIYYPDIGIFNWIPLIFCFFGFQTYLKSNEQRKKCSFYFLCGSIPVLVSVFGQVFLNWETTLKTLNGLIIWYLRPIEDFNAASGLFNNPNYLGSWLNIIWPFCLSFLFSRETNRLKKIILFLITTLVFISILLCASRASLLCLILSVPIFIWRDYGKWLIYIFSGIFLLFFLSFIPNFGELIKNITLNTFPNELVNNFRQDTYSIDISRIDIWTLGLKKIIENPLWGQGSNSFPAYIQSITGYWKGHSHNLPIELIINYGSIAGLLILIPFTIILSSGFKKLFLVKDFRFHNNLLDRAWVISLLLLALANLVDITYYDGRISITGWILLAGIRNIIKENQNRIKYSKLLN